MNELPSEELLSALLDGQLDAAEEARVRAWLAESPAAQQLFEELRGVRASLQSLPSHRLGADFSAQVLRQAEREMLAGRTAAAAPTIQLSTAERPTGWARWRRPVLWSSLAAAAAVVVMVLTPGQFKAPNQVAVTPTSTAPAVADPHAAKRGAPGHEMLADNLTNRLDESTLGRTGAVVPQRSMVQDEDLARASKLGVAAPRYATQTNAQQYDLNMARVRGQSPESVVVVQVALTPQAARQRQFDQVLLNNAIDIQDAAAADGQAPALLADENAQVFGQPTGDAPAGTLDVFYVEATDAQLDATLAEMAAQPDAFAAVVVAEDARGEALEQLAPVPTAALTDTALTDTEQSPVAPAGEAATPAAAAPVQAPADVAQQAVPAPDDNVDRAAENRAKAGRPFTRRGIAQRLPQPAQNIGEYYAQPPGQGQAAARPNAAAQSAVGQDADAPAPTEPAAPQPAAQPADVAPAAQPEARDQSALQADDTLRRVLFVLQILPENQVPSDTVAPPLAPPASNDAPQPD